jgi:2-keto-4-pentenoate hydratase
MSYTTEEALEFIASLHLGVEIASSPFAGINDHGPLVTISDFGNNYGLILSDEITDWKGMDLASWVFETFINDQSVGKSAPVALPGGPVESVRFLLENTSRRGHILKKGTMILTGAVTGVHQAYAEDTGSVKLGDDIVRVKLTELTS